MLFFPKKSFALHSQYTQSVVSEEAAAFLRAGSRHDSRREWAHCNVLSFREIFYEGNDLR